MRESRLENRLVKHVEKLGGRCWKWTSPGTVGVPDRMCLLPGGRLLFVEMKAPGEKPTPIQLKRHGQLRDLGFEVRVIDSEAGVDAV